MNLAAAARRQALLLMTRVARVAPMSLMPLVLAGLVGCASTPPPPASDLLSGRLAIQVAGQPDKSFSAGFELSGTPRAGQLLLSGPLGSTAARARWSPTEAVLNTAQGESSFASLDALTLATLGEAIPLAALFDWLRGRPWPGAAATPRDDGLAGFAQLGWQVDLSRWSVGALESRRNSPPVITVRARLEQAP